ncbi:MAG: 50S ribosomal protein L10 [Chloroflexi bacterium HGW-Chloroflexi-10]|nr:MAG: 50S ribosomal protein L10 [Chloroflexi bacterium HGW-Chloroflexi-10]
MAFTKKYKSKMMSQYEQWLEKSEAIFFISYEKMNMKDIDTLRAKVRETGGELHVVKNTLLTKAYQNKGIKSPVGLEGTTLAGIAFSDPPALAKVFKESTKKSEIFAVKGGYLGTRSLSAKEVDSLAELPPLPVMRAMLLGTISAPASKLVRTLAEPARGLAAVIKAHSEQPAG